MHSVLLSSDAEAFFAHADPPLRKKLERCFSHLAQSPRSGNNVKRLTGKLAGIWRYRVGDWRVLYEIDDRAQMVYVLTIAHRREVYE